MPTIEITISEDAATETYIRRDFETLDDTPEVILQALLGAGFKLEGVTITSGDNDWEAFLPGPVTTLPKSAATYEAEPDEAPYVSPEHVEKPTTAFRDGQRFRVTVHGLCGADVAAGDVVKVAKAHEGLFVSLSTGDLWWFDPEHVGNGLEPIPAEPAPFCTDPESADFNADDPRWVLHLTERELLAAYRVVVAAAPDVRNAHPGVYALCRDAEGAGMQCNPDYVLSDACDELGFSYSLEQARDIYAVLDNDGVGMADARQDHRNAYRVLRRLQALPDLVA